MSQNITTLQVPAIFYKLEQVLHYIETGYVEVAKSYLYDEFYLDNENDRNAEYLSHLLFLKKIEESIEFIRMWQFRYINNISAKNRKTITSTQRSRFLDWLWSEMPSSKNIAH